MRPNDAIVDQLVAAHGQVQRTPDSWLLPLGASRWLRFYYTESWALIWAEERACGRTVHGCVGLELRGGQWHFMGISEAQRFSIPPAYHEALVALTGAIMGHDRDAALLRTAMTYTPSVSYPTRVEELGFPVTDYTTAPGAYAYVYGAVTRAIARWQREYRIHPKAVLLGQPVPLDRAWLTVDGLEITMVDANSSPHPAIYVFGPLGSWYSGLDAWASGLPIKEVWEAPTASRETVRAYRDTRRAPLKQSRPAATSEVTP